MVSYTLLDELLFPLFRPLIALAQSAAAVPAARRMARAAAALCGAAARWACPFVVIEPMKVVAIWWAGTGHVVTGTIALLLAHALSLLVVERIFHAVYQPLMRIDWFAGCLSWLFALRDRAISWAKSTAAMAGGGGVGCAACGSGRGGCCAARRRRTRGLAPSALLLAP